MGMLFRMFAPKPLKMNVEPRAAVYGLAISAKVRNDDVRLASAGAAASKAATEPIKTTLAIRISGPLPYRSPRPGVRPGPHEKG